MSIFMSHIVYFAMETMKYDFSHDLVHLFSLNMINVLDELFNNQYFMIYQIQPM